MQRNSSQSKPDYEYYYNSFVETFAKQQYAWLAQYAEYCAEAYDLGAQAGDSAIYLAMQGYTHIYCYEPDVVASKLLEANMSSFRPNSQAVELFNSKINFAFDKNGRIANILLIEIFDHKAPEPFKPRNSDQLYAIKCDVEGAEHQIFTEDADLANCIALQIEYHFGPQKLPEILKAKGFDVKVDKPWATTEDLGEVGWIYASRR
ncbi:MAG: hypothetical protein QW575_04395 [Thermoproteota archaeon]